MMSKKFLSILLVFVVCVAFSVTAIAQSSDYDAEQEAAERVKRQLELANELREKRLKKQREKQEQLRIEEQLEKHCARLKDELRRLGERRRWYQLNEKGERIYLTDSEVRHKKASVQKVYDRQCEEYR
jgi:flagellar motility protein MotE (MotC chaperone)